MDDTQLILTALSQVPDLVEAARTYKDVNDKAINTISTAVKQQPKAIIPDSEMEKLKNNISQTPCALPETDAFTKELANQVYKIIAPVIRSEIKSAVGATDITINHEHTHRHHSIAGFWNIVNDVAKKWIIGLGIFSVVSIGAFAYCMHYVRNSELFLGKRCMDIYISDYVTEKEKKEMLKDCYWIAFYPKKYQDSPQALRERIRKNETIIKDREFQSHFKKGKFRTDKTVEF
jgi:hypothetical protein